MEVKEFFKFFLLLVTMEYVVLDLCLFIHSYKIRQNKLRNYFPALHSRQNSTVILESRETQKMSYIFAPALAMSALSLPQCWQVEPKQSSKLLSGRDRDEFGLLEWLEFSVQGSGKEGAAQSREGQHPPQVFCACIG